MSSEEIHWKVELDDQKALPLGLVKAPRSNGNARNLAVVALVVVSLCDLELLLKVNPSDKWSEAEEVLLLGR